MEKKIIPILRFNYSEDDITFIQNGVKEILLSGHLTMGEKVRRFESEFAGWIGCKYALGTNSGTSSLEIPLRAIGVEGKTVVCPSNTYMATPIAAIHAGASVIFADSQPDNLQMDPASLKSILDQESVAAVIIVHIGGIISPHFWEIKGLCDTRGVPLIEDAAHAHGATIDGKFAGTLGLTGSFSFFPTKVLNTAEGGMVTTDDKSIYEKGVILREHGKTAHLFNLHSEFGYNWRFSELHALLGLRQIRKADEILRERRKIAQWYDDLLVGVEGIRRIYLPDNVKSAYYKYICYLDEKISRDGLKRKLKEEYGVSLTGEVYSDPCHSQPVFKQYPDKMRGCKNLTFDGTDYINKHHICLPLYPGLSKDEVEYVVNALKLCIGNL